MNYRRIYKILQQAKAEGKITTMKLLDRSLFRESVFERDGHQCVFCESPAVDAHHILDRALWPDGGYYLDNGASVCETHHLECEKTNISVEQVREAAGITNVILPPQLSRDEKYDKWGNQILNNGTRIKGPMFRNEGTQKMLKAANALTLFSDRVKYPRTPHLPWSPGADEDDVILDATTHFKDKYVIVTEKMDGECTTLYRDHIHARSLDSSNHPTRNWVKSFWGTIRHEIPEGWRVCGENLYAKHSIFYDDLPSFFMGFSVWTDQNICLSWDDTKEWFRLLNICPVPVLAYGIWQTLQVEKNMWSLMDPEKQEGYVVRLEDSFSFEDFGKSVAKFVRKGHVQTDEHWMHQEIVPNRMRR